MKNLIYLIISITLFACNSKKDNLPKEFDFGKTKSGLYTNAYFNLKVNFNPSWIIQDKQQMNNLVEMGNNLVSGDDNTLKAVLEASQVNTAYLLTIFKYEYGSAVEFNPSFMIIAENKKSFPGMKNGADYLFHAKRMLEQTQLEYYFEKDFYDKTIGKTKFYVMEAKLNNLNKTITQEFITTISDGFSLSFVASYSTEDEKNELYRIINSIKI